MFNRVKELTALGLDGLGADFFIWHKSIGGHTDYIVLVKSLLFYIKLCYNIISV